MECRSPCERMCLIVGGGNAALCAAIAAREAGAEVLVLEQAPKHMRGGNTRHTRNLRAMHESATATLPGSYTEEEYFADLMQVTSGFTDQVLARMMIRKSAELVDWLRGRGVHFQPALSGSLNLGRTNAFFLGGGKALLNALYLTARKLGIQVEYDSEVVSLCIEDGVFHSAGVVSSPPEAGGAVRRSGSGFWRFPRPTWTGCRRSGEKQRRRFLIRGSPYNKGRILRLLLDKGMQRAGMADQCHAVAIDARAPRFDGGIVTRPRLHLLRCRGESEGAALL